MPLEELEFSIKEASDAGVPQEEPTSCTSPQLETYVFYVFLLAFVFCEPESIKLQVHE